jgi:putative two-component system response regulator
MNTLKNSNYAPNLSFFDHDPKLNQTESPWCSHQRLLIVDDEDSIRRVLALELKKSGYDCLEANSGEEALEIAGNQPVDAVLSDLQMPGMDGLELLREIKRRFPDVAVVMITGNHEVDSAIAAIQAEADDYLLKPFDWQTIRCRIERALERTALKKKVREYQNGLEEMLARRTTQINRLTLHVIQSLVTALEARDPSTDGHSRRVTLLARQLGIAVGLNHRDLEILQVAAMFHDLGKIGIRENILTKQGSLSDEELEHIKSHPEIGVKVLEPLLEFHEILPLILHHHERYDGCGYPSGISGDSIPVGARILAVVDSFDAMVSDRPYRSGIPIVEAFVRLRGSAGSQLDPLLVQQFLALAEKGILKNIPTHPDTALSTYPIRLTA